MAADRPLTARHQAFVDAYIANSGNGTQAAVTAGYSPSRAHVTASELVRNRKVAAAIAARRREAAERADIEATDVIRGLAQLAFADIGELLAWDAEGVSVVPSARLTAGQRAAVKKVRWTRTDGRERFEFELHDRLHALDSLARILGMFRIQIDHSLIETLAREWGLDVDEVLRETEAIMKHARTLPGIGL